MTVDGRVERRAGGGAKPAAAPARYILATAVGALTAFALFCGLYGVLYASGHLPPPPLTNNICADEKLVFFRHNHPADPNFLIAGSSVAWRNIDSAVIAERLPGARPVNGGFCGMKINQSAFIADWFLDRWPSIDRVLLVTSPIDYAGCTGIGRVFDPVDADKFVFERQPAWSFYLRYFDPVSLRRNIRRQIEDREQARRLKVQRGFTEFGDGPLDTDQDRGLFYGPMPPADPACLAALRQMAMKVRGSGRELLVVATPLHPHWEARYDPDGAFASRLARQVEEALQGTGARVWNTHQADVLGSAAFTDAIHVRWSAAGTFTNAILDHFGGDKRGRCGRGGDSDPRLRPREEPRDPRRR